MSNKQMQSCKLHTYFLSDSDLLFLDFLPDFCQCCFPPFHLALVKTSQIFPERTEERQTSETSLTEASLDTVNIKFTPLIVSKGSQRIKNRISHDDIV